MAGDQTNGIVRDPLDAPRPVSAFSLANVLLRHRRPLLGMPLIAMTAAVVFVLLREPEFVAESAFMPQTPGAQGNRLATLAEQFGVSFGSPQSSAESVATYAELIKSRELLTAAASTDYAFASATEDGRRRSGTLMDLYEIEAPTPEERLRVMVAMLNERVVANADAVTGIVRVSTRAPWPELAVAINDRLLELVNDFNLQRRQSQARAEREFVQTRLDEAQTELREAEAVLSRFLEENRRYQDSPPLELEYRRLQRQVDIQQQIYVSLTSNYEQARIAEVRNTPVITIIDNPEGSQRRVQTGLATALALALILGVVAGATVAFGMDYLRVQREANPQDFAQFTELGRAALPGLGGGRARARGTTVDAPPAEEHART